MKFEDKVVIYGLDDECFLIADTIELDGFSLGQAKQFNITGDYFQIDTDTNEVKKFGRRTINYSVEVNMIFNPDEP